MRFSIFCRLLSCLSIICWRRGVGNQFLSPGNCLGAFVDSRSHDHPCVGSACLDSVLFCWPFHLLCASAMLTWWSSVISLCVFQPPPPLFFLKIVLVSRFQFPIWLLESRCQFLQKCLLGFWLEFIESMYQFWEGWHLKLNFPVHDCGLSLHLFRFYLIFLSNVW